ncbi:DNA-processing protein DprA [Sphingomonas sp. Leaf10]|uniref:DNA-processing protein DprA n=1 Tax=Sphingomonas sp. Leaf10 TaxID=1735676 RepID=UPI0009E8E495|nr:DNA-processing protein DprA [Sphingomonas sp. Leaf10]
MSETISPNTQAILLLTAPLIARGGDTSADLLPLGLYKKLARRLRELNFQPADLLTSDSANVIRSCEEVVEPDRLKRLLDRGFLLSQVIERWQARAIWVISRADQSYPKRLKRSLREDAPAVLYGCGAVERLDDGGLAIVGSRHVDDDLVCYTEAVGAMAAGSHYPVVSGGAKGIDQAAMRGAAEAGGQVVGVLGDGLEKAAMLREHRAPLMDGRLVLVSPYDPSARFNVGHAMQRNKLIYAFADAALVVSSDVGRGGTWAGATEQLDRYRFVPIYVRQSGGVSEGLDALRRQGARVWPEPKDRDEFASIFEHDAKDEPSADNSLSTQYEYIGTSAPEVDTSPLATEPLQPVAAEIPPPADRLWGVVRPVLADLLTTPRGETAVAEALDVSKVQARAWLARLTSEGAANKDKSNRYVVVRDGLFEFAR